MTQSNYLRQIAFWSGQTMLGECMHILLTTPICNRLLKKVVWPKLEWPDVNTTSAYDRQHHVCFCFNSIPLHYTPMSSTDVPTLLHTSVCHRFSGTTLLYCSTVFTLLLTSVRRLNYQICSGVAYNSLY